MFISMDILVMDHGVVFFGVNYLIITYLMLFRDGMKIHYGI